ncbi:uncharacterized protein PRCAT00005335001 [Priceomyces carsonii]|uniref:uncharacterized protein n=1 Tax=Priceomyces carsonii TaxID=28549 RepID=UPI002EDAFBAB|nr:unnamed protein product [Priceomyces carsonii]
MDKDELDLGDVQLEKENKHPHELEPIELSNYNANERESDSNHRIKAQLDDSINDSQSNSKNNQSKRKIREYFRWTIVVKNEGSMARDQLANERTLLAWVRTASYFTLAALGAVQIYRLESKAASYSADVYSDEYKKYSEVIKQFGKCISPIMICMSLLALLIGTFTYFHVQEKLYSGYYPAPRILVIVLIVINFSVVLLMFVLDIKLS